MIKTIPVGTPDLDTLSIVKNVVNLYQKHKNKCIALAHQCKLKQICNLSVCTCATNYFLNCF